MRLYDKAFVIIIFPGIRKINAALPEWDVMYFGIVQCFGFLLEFLKGF